MTMRPFTFGLALSLCLMLLVPLFARARASSRQPAFRSGTTLVEVSAIVTNDEGGPIKDLTVEEVEVLDDGVLQSIVLFEHVDFATAVGSQQRRDFVLVLDDLSIAPKDTEAAMAISDALINSLGPHDRLAIVNTGPFPLVQQLSTERSIARKLVRQLRGQKGTSPLSFSAVQVCHNTTVALRVIENAMRVMAQGVVERRAVLVVSEGHRLFWLETGTKGADRCDQARAAYERIIAASALANVAVYGVDVRGLVAQAPDVSGGGPAASAQSAGTAAATAAQQRADTLYGSLGRMALATGGTLTAERNDLMAAVRQMIDDTRQYYRIAYVQPDIPRRDRGKVRRIEVNVRRPGVNVRARQRYLPR